MDEKTSFIFFSRLSVHDHGYLITMCMTNRYWANTVVVISENINLLNHSARILQTYRQTDRHRALKMSICRARLFSSRMSLCHQLPPEKRAHPLPPNFGPCLLWPNDWMDEDAAWYGSRPRLRPHCNRRNPSSRERGTQQAHNIAPIFSHSCQKLGQ